MSLVSIDSSSCINCGLCIQSCPAGLLFDDKKETPAFKSQFSEKCILCGHCVAVCPKGALDHSLLPQDEFLQVPKNTVDSDTMKSFLLSRRSIRGFKKTPVPKEQIEQLIDVSRRAPTASNSQNVNWTVITSPDTLEKVRKLTLDWIKSNGATAYIEADKMGLEIVLRGGTSLIVAHTPKEYNWNMTDCAIALTYMELYASSLHLGACWAGLVTRASQSIPELKEILGVPESNNIGGALILGIPKQKHYLIPPRKKATINWI